VNEARVDALVHRRSHPSVWLSWAASALAVCTAVAAVTYLRPVSNGTWVHLGLALIVLIAPFVARPPWSRERIFVGALVWFVIGLPGAWVFGTPVYYAGLLLGVAPLADLLVRHAGVRSSAKHLGSRSAG